jgi:predicted metal-dependent peptidase
MTHEETLSRNLRRAVSKDVGLASVLLYVPAVVVDRRDRVAWTDGTRMYFAARYFEYTPEQQVAIAIHEGLHVAFRHAQRGRIVASREGSAFAPALWNLACDAVINNAIRVCRWCMLPPDARFPEHCLSGDQLRKRPAELWAAEEIYFALRSQPLRGELAQSDGRSFGEDLADCAESVHGAQRLHESTMEDGIWRQRVIRAQAGATPGSVLRRLSADIPKATVRWQAVLRDFLKVRLMPTTESSWSRPSRRILSLGRDARWLEAGVARKQGIRRAAVVIDTSGSIADQVLQAFISEINRLIVDTGCELVLVDCDAQVQQISVHHEPIYGYVAKGGGGTDFRPAIDALRRMPLDVAVYFTDLMGTFPEKGTAFPLLWAVTLDLDVPFGQKLLLPTRGSL